MNDIVLNPKAQEYLKILEDLNKPREFGLEVGLKTRLHEGQITALKGLYKEDAASVVIVPSGRKFGKTELAGYALWRQALTKPYSECYYVCPEGTHGRKLVWNNFRLQRFLGNDSQKYIKTVRNNEMSIVFKNGSFIQVIGSENFGVANGLTPDIAVYDEFKLFHPRWHIDFEPNLAPKAAPLIIIGTLPTPGDKNEAQYKSLLEDAAHDESIEVHIRTTWDNPINLLPKQKKTIERKIAALRRRGEEDVVQREYYSKIIPGGKRAIFPMLSQEAHVLDHKSLTSKLSKDLSRMEWQITCDPGSTTVFGALVMAMNPYTKQVYVLDEIYETDQMNTSTRVIYPRLEMKAQALYPNSSMTDDWIKTYDQQAAWFATEVMNQYNVYFSPSAKHMKTKEEGLSLIKDMLIHELLVISDNCPNLYKEMQGYAKDNKGNIPKINDHLIDALRYALIAWNYDMHEVVEAIKTRAVEANIEEGRYRAGRYDREVFKEEEDWFDMYDF